MPELIKPPQPIGIFDSGIGGLTVLKQVHHQLPSENIVYFGDTARVPYGTKSKETITQFSAECVRFLLGFDIKMVIVACNTASSLGLDFLKNNFSVPMIGVIEPGAREALAQTKNGRIGVIGTKSTIGSGSYEACLKRLDPSVKVYSQACPLFVPFVEEGWLEGEITEKVVEAYLGSLKNFEIDTLILGCTHYPLLKNLISRVVGEKITLVDSAEETAKEAREAILKNEMQTDSTVASAIRFYVSDEPEQFRIGGERFLKQPIPFVTKVGDHLKGVGEDALA